MASQPKDLDLNLYRLENLTSRIATFDLLLQSVYFYSSDSLKNFYIND